MADPNKFRFSIDRGGTFTDIYAEVPGEPGFRVEKLLSENPEKYSDAPLEGIRRILAQHRGEAVLADAIDADCIEWIRMGTTVATNALLQRSGARTALVITKGFRDLLQIGKQNRPRIFDLEIKKPSVLVTKVIEVKERVRLLSSPPPGGDPSFVQTISGDWVEILQAPDMDHIKQALLSLRQEGIESLCVVTLHSYVFPEHEIAIGKLAHELGFQQVSLSAEVLPKIKMVDRGQTACVEAYLAPLIQDYLKKFRQGFPQNPPELFFMQSDGGLVPAEEFSGCRAILSGPAGGVVGYAMTTFNEKNKQPVIGFDMGGTSTDISRFDGEYEWVHESEVAGLHIQVPQLDIRTVAAGGGSRLFFRNGMFEVGPESSGAHPGPVCYQKDGPLSLTDANLVLGRLLPQYFPKVFGPNEDQPLDAKRTEQAFAKLTETINAHSANSSDRKKSLEEVALGFVEVANENMVRPIREISMARGFDIKDHVLACFGGAGGQHACAIARTLGIRKIFIHRFAGILSAYGLGLADVVVEKQEPASVELNPASIAELEKRLSALSQKAVEELNQQGHFEVSIQRFLNLRYQGTDTALMIQQTPEKDFKKLFIEKHRREFGFDFKDRDLIVDDLRVRVVGCAQKIKKTRTDVAAKATEPVHIAQCYFKAGWQETPVFPLDALGAGEEIKGPAILIHDTTTILVEPGCAASITDYGDVEIAVLADEKVELDTAVDPVRIAIFGNRFMSIAEQMGRTLQRTATSTNIKERLDFSCAIFGPSGDLIANAPHQPVHLGAMGEAVKAQMQIHSATMQARDVWVSNHPAFGGSHLPDITVITPVIRQGKVIFFVANRGHHADVGGITPGSMPPFSKTLQEEGVVIQSFKLVAGEVFQEAGITRLLQAKGEENLIGTRALRDNLSDLKAQVAANQKGIELLEELVEQNSLEVVQAYMNHLQEVAAQSVQSMLSDLSLARNLQAVDTLTAQDRLDDGSIIQLQLTLDRNAGTAVFDFSGTAGQLPNNMNTPKAVTHSAVIYCLRSLVQSEIPLNQGCLRSVKIILPEGSILSPSEDAAVVAGNVLTSQRITDVIFKAFSACAASQGCMNNLTFGNESFAYYETMGGGAGAGPSWHGQSGVHTHMSNTRITDPEILEKRYPVLLTEFSIRKGSGGAGHYRGGDGLIREIEFLEPLHVAILSERRVIAPYGLKGGEAGAVGKNFLIKKHGSIIDLGGKNQFEAEPGDRIRILTPGGGGYGNSG